MRLLRATLLVQTVYYSITAIWPLVHIDSFMEITGPKTDIWLVKTVAVLLAAISISFLTSLFYNTYHKPTIALAITCCIVLTIIDCYYVWNGTISKVYLLDAAVEIILLLLWIFAIMGINKKQE